MFALVIVVATAAGLIIPPEMPVFGHVEKCEAVAHEATQSFARMDGVISVRYRCVMLAWPEARGV